MNFEPGRNQEIWLQTLEQGIFKQGRMFLHDQRDDSYCCLGVAAEIFKTYANNIGCRVLGGTRPAILTRYDGECAGAPIYVVKLLGLHGQMGDARKPGCSLAHLNDNALTHREIAEVIRENPSLYFSEPR